MNKRGPTQIGQSLKGGDYLCVRTGRRGPRLKHMVDEAAMGRSRNVMLLAFATAAVAGIVSFRPSAQAGDMSTVACYVALANDLTPLLHPGAPDNAASSAECGSHPTTEEGRHPDPRVVGSTGGNGQTVTDPRTPTHRLGSRPSASVAAALPSSSSVSGASSVCREDANIGDLISQCLP